MRNFLKNKDLSLSGKTVAITGATGGIGKELCRLILLAGARLIMIDRNPEKAKFGEEILKSEFPLSEIERITFNMENALSVKNLAEQIKMKGADILIHNAGAYKIPLKQTESGYNNVFTINFISPYLLSCALKDELERIVVVGSIAHNYSKSDEKDIDFSGKRGFHLIYGNAKRYLMYSHFKLAKNNPNLKVAVTHPGITLTGITDHYPKWLYKIIKPLMKIVFMKPSLAAKNIFAGLFFDTPPYSWIGPRFFNIWGGPSLKKLNTAKVCEIEKIAEKSEEILNFIEKH